MVLGGELGPTLGAFRFSETRDYKQSRLPLEESSSYETDTDTIVIIRYVLTFFFRSFNFISSGTLFA